MSLLLETLGAASKGMSAQQQRMRIVSENIANLDTPGYRRKLVSFQNAVNGRSEGPEIGDISLDKSELKEVFEPAHPMADGRGYVRMSNVDLVTEIADSREAQRTHQANLSMFDQARRMYGGVLDLLKR